MEPLPCRTFEDVIEAVRTGKADLAMLPVENSTYGRVADIHRLLPESGLHIVDEAFVRVHISLLGVPGARLSDVREAMSHTGPSGAVPRASCASTASGPTPAADTAGGARGGAGGDPHRGALASELAAEIYGLDVLARPYRGHGSTTPRAS